MELDDICRSFWSKRRHFNGWTSKWRESRESLNAPNLQNPLGNRLKASVRPHKQFRLWPPIFSFCSILKTSVIVVVEDLLILYSLFFFFCIPLSRGQKAFVLLSPTTRRWNVSESVLARGWGGHCCKVGNWDFVQGGWSEISDLFPPL